MEAPGVEDDRHSENTPFRLAEFACLPCEIGANNCREFPYIAGVLNAQNQIKRIEK